MSHSWPCPSAAAVTERVELITNVVLAPLHVNAALLAKQAASLDDLSEGRLVLGLGAGGNPEDFGVSGVDYHTRGRAFDDQLGELRAFWQGDRLGPISGEAVGPSPYRGRRLPVLIGGHSAPAFRRAARYGDGWCSADMPDGFAEGVAKMRGAWSAEGRAGAPRLAAMFYFALGDAGHGGADDNLLRFYNATSAASSRSVLESVARGADAIRGTIAAFEQAGADDVLCVPASADAAEVDLLADIAL